MNDMKQRLIHLHHCRGIGYETLKKMLDVDASLQTIYKMSKKELCGYFSIRSDRISSFFHDLQMDCNDILKMYKKRNIAIITIEDDHYPPLLKQIYNPPFVLYALGDPSIMLRKKQLAVVGTRDPSPLAKENMKHILHPIIEQDWIIVSGLAYGIDTLAHTLAVENNGTTIAVLGSGFMHIYPKKNKRLAEKIANDHLLLSEYPLHYPPKRWQFPFRNRIIAGLTKGTFVVEAKKQSGSLITAACALNEGREIFACPGPPIFEQACGVNELIQQGAKLVVQAKDIIEELQYF